MKSTYDIDLSKIEVIRLLFYKYAQCIDDSNLDEWPNFFVDDCLYRIIPKENENFDEPFAILYADNKNQLKDRVIIIKKALVYSLRYYRHNITNIFTNKIEDGIYHVTSNYVVYSTDQVNGQTILFSVGKYKSEIIFKNKKPYFKNLDVLVDTYSIQRQMPIPL